MVNHKISWRHSKSHEDDPWNEMADSLCKIVAKGEANYFTSQYLCRNVHVLPYAFKDNLEAFQLLFLACAPDVILAQFLPLDATKNSAVDILSIFEQADKF